MDPRELEEHHQDDLQRAVSTAKKLWAEYGTWTLGTIALVLVIFVGMRMYESRAYTRHEQAWSALHKAATAAECEQLAARAGDPGVAQRAYLKAGDILLAKLMVPINENDPKQKQDRAEQIEAAEAMYRKLVDDANTALVYRLNARLGLGTVAENKGDWDAAAEQYRTIEAEGEGHYPVIVAQAQARLAVLPKVKEPVVFGPEATLDLDALTPKPQQRKGNGDGAADEGADSDAEGADDATDGGGASDEEGPAADQADDARKSATDE